MARKSVHNLYIHASERILERYGEEINKARYHEMCQDIREGRAVFLHRESNMRSHFLLEDKFICVYHKGLKGICTFLPPENIWAYLPQKKS